MKNEQYKLSVPVVNLNFHDHMNREKTVELMKQMHVERVFLAIGTGSLSGEKREMELNALKENAEYLHDFDFEVGAWFWTFMDDEKNGYTMMTSPDGKKSSSVVCPTDENYCKLMHSFLVDCTATGVDMIMFDDDFRYGFHDIGFGCLCENHCKLICGQLGENVSRETIAEGVMNGGKNRYRDAFIAANGIALENFARGCRESVDSVNPNVRLGFCSCITSWDIDGTTPDRISEILAGNTKPFYRLIGAPYWAAMGAWGHSRISYVIEQERLEANRRIDKNIEIFSEGDTFPRPRHRVPSAYLEGLDTVLRADGCTNGILKYSFDYAADYDFESGYNQNHINNLPLYEAIDEMFSDRETVGVRVYDKAEKFADVSMPTNENNSSHVQELAFNVGARFLASNSIPTAYSGNEYSGVAFGEDAKILTTDDINAGVILDFAAARILSEKGIDTGLDDEDTLVQMGDKEYFADGEKIGHLSAIRLHKCKLNKNAVVDSYSLVDGEKVPVFYRYQNAGGQCFAVYTFDGYSSDEEIFRNYKRQEQIIDSVRWLSSKNPPVICTGNPDLYILAKKNGNKLSAGLWNFFPDRIFSPCVEFSGEIKSIRTYGAKGEFTENKVTLSDIEPYGFAAVEVKFE